MRWAAIALEWTRLRRDTRGATAVELGLVAMPFFAVICAIFEIAFVNVQNEMLAAAVSKAARSMLTGQAQNAQISSSSAFVSTYMCPTTGRTLPMSFDCSKLIVDVRPSLTFAAGDTSNNFYKSSTNQFCPGGPGQIVVLRVAYPLGAIFPLNLFSRNVGVVNDVPKMSGWYHILEAGALFQEENYAGNFTPPSGC